MSPFFPASALITWPEDMSLTPFPLSDVKAIKAWDKLKNSDESSVGWDCEYVEYSTVPDQAGGPFWSILNRIFIRTCSPIFSFGTCHGYTQGCRLTSLAVMECLLLTLSEVGVPKRLFEESLPILGPAHGLGALGVFQALYVFALGAV